MQKKTGLNWTGWILFQKMFLQRIRTLIVHPVLLNVPSDYVRLFHGPPSVLKVDICSILEGVICLYLTPVALSEFLNPFFQLLCLTLSPLLQHSRNTRLLGFLLVSYNSPKPNTLCFIGIYWCMAMQLTKLRTLLALLHPLLDQSVVWKLKVADWLQIINVFKFNKGWIHAVLFTFTFADCHFIFPQYNLWI